MKRIVIILIVVVIGIIGVVLYISNKNKSAAAEKSYTVTRTTLDVPLIFSGEIKAKEMATVRFQTAGKITSIQASEGDEIKKGQVIASLDQRLLQNDMQQLLNSYMNNRWSFEQTKSDNQSTSELGASQLVRERAKRIIEQSQFSLNNAVLAVEAQALSLEFSHIYAPLSGIVTAAPDIVAGTNITTPTQAEFQIINPASLYFEAKADQTEVTALSPGQTATITLDAFPDSSVSAIIKHIAFTPTPGEVGTVYGIDLDIATLNHPYRLGMTGDVSFVTASKSNVLTVPLTYVTTKDNASFVKVKENNNVVEKEVTLGLENDNDVEILSGINEGDVIYD